RMCSSALVPLPMHVAAAMFTPASLMALATAASAPGALSTSMTRSIDMSELLVSDRRRADHPSTPARRPRSGVVEEDAGARATGAEDVGRVVQRARRQRQAPAPDA